MTKPLNICITCGIVQTKQVLSALGILKHHSYCHSHTPLPLYLRCIIVRHPFCDSTYTFTKYSLRYVRWYSLQVHHYLRIQSVCLSQRFSSSSLHVFQVFRAPVDTHLLKYVVVCSRYSVCFDPHQNRHPVCNTSTNNFHLHRVLNRNTHDQST